MAVAQLSRPEVHLEARRFRVLVVLCLSGCQGSSGSLGHEAQPLVGPPTVQLRYPGFHAGDLATVGSARVLDDGTLRLTSADELGHTGAAWIPFPIPILGGFRAEASFRIANAGGINGGGDGLTLVVQGRGPSAIGEGGCQIGYGGLPRSAVVELDTFPNDFYCGEIADPDGNHVGIHANLADPQQGTSPLESSALGRATLPFDLKDGAMHRLVVAYDDHALTVTLDGAATLTGVSIDLASIATADGKAWLGFTSATSAAWADHDIVDLSVEAHEAGACPFVCGDAGAPEPLDNSYCASAGLFCSCEGRAAGEPALPIACAPEAGFCRSECGYDDKIDRLACISIGEVPADCPAGGPGGGGGGGGAGGPGGGGGGPGGGGGGGGGGNPVPCPCDGFVDASGNTIDTDACGQTACGGADNVWMCTLAGWQDLGFACGAGGGGGGGGGQSCACNASAFGGRPWITHACGRVACDTDGEEWVCTPSDFSQIGTRCRQGFTPTILCTEGAIAPEPPGGLGSPLAPALEAAVRQLVAIAQQSHNPLLIAFVQQLVDTLWQAKLDLDRAAARTVATDRVRFDHFAGLGWQLVGAEWTGARVDRMLDGLARMEAVYGQARVDVHAAPWTLFHDHGLPDEAKGEVLTYDADFLGLPRHIRRIRIELDGRASAISEEQQIELAVHGLHHAVIAPVPAGDALAAPAQPPPSSSPSSPSFVPVPGSFGDSWVDAIWPEGHAIEPALAVSQFALLGAGEDLADSGTAFVSAELNLAQSALAALLGGRLGMFQQLAQSCSCPLDSGELLRVNESFCNRGTQTLACRRIDGACAIQVTAGSCTPPFEEQCFCPTSSDVQYGSCGQEICDQDGGGWQVLQCSSRVWQSAGGSCTNGCLPGTSCRPVVVDPDRPQLQWVNRRRCLAPCGYTLPDPVTITGNTVLRRDAANAYWGMRAAWRVAQRNAGIDIPLGSALRDYGTQIGTFISQRAGADCVYGMAYSAVPGHSEHQTGDAMDITAWTIDFLVTQPRLPLLATFIEENACKWGFVRSYPANTMSITGYTPELWHWRYVGRQRALFLRPVQNGVCAQSGPTIEEYLAEHPDEALTSDCGGCAAVTQEDASECLATVPPLPVPPSSPPPCPGCAPFTPPPPTAQVAVVPCVGTPPSITLRRNFVSQNTTNITAGGLVEIVNEGTEPVYLSEPWLLVAAANATVCLSFGTAGGYGVFETEHGASANIFVDP